jgi:hypothetical protein
MRTSNFALRLQPSLFEAARELAKSEGVALNQLINVAVAQMVAANSTARYFELRGRRANVRRALEILHKAGLGNPPLPGDELPEGLHDDRTEQQPSRPRRLKPRRPTRSTLRK